MTITPEKIEELRDEAVTRLAECLFNKMERMDPSGLPLWEHLREDQRDFYRRSIEEILLERALLDIAEGAMWRDIGECPKEGDDMYLAWKPDAEGQCDCVTFYPAQRALMMAQGFTKYRPLTPPLTQQEGE